MTHQSENPMTDRSHNQRSLLLAGLSCISSFSLLGAGVVSAQTPEPTVTGADTATTETLVVPSADDLLAPALQEAAPLPTATIEAPPAPIELSPPAPVVEVAPAEASAPGETELSADELVAPDLVEKAATLGNQGEAYIDTTSYDVGATMAPGAVVLSERSTGCEAIIAKGAAAPTSICPPTIGSAGTFSTGYETVSAGSMTFSGGGAGFSLGRVTPAGRDYYNLTMRPPALLGNGNMKLMFPLSIPSVISSAFGWRMHPVTGDARFHSGTDLAAAMGTPVLAAFSGKVSIADFMGGYGLTVVLEHEKNTTQTLYAHLSELFVEPGDTVKQGEVIGRVGSTGLSTGPHLHFEFRQLTSDGWVALDAGQTLEYSLAQFIEALKTGKSLTAMVNQPIDPLQRLKQVMRLTLEKKAEAKAAKAEKAETAQRSPVE